MTPTPTELDEATVDLIFALRDSLTSLSRLDFWDGRATTAIETAAAGSESAGQAITTASRKLQIDTLTTGASKTALKAASVIDRDYQAWAAHVARNIVYIVALANVARATRATRKAASATPSAAPATTKEPTF